MGRRPAVSEGLVCTPVSIRDYYLAVRLNRFTVGSRFEKSGGSVAGHFPGTTIVYVAIA